MTDRMDTEALRSGLFLIVKRDLYYRPNDCGYTGIKDHAGRYTLEEVAVRFPNMESPHQDGTSFVAEEDAPEFTKACFWDLKLDHVTKQRDDARAEVLELRAKAVDTIDAQSVADALDDDKRRWLTCSGCHETEDGHDMGHYPYSPALQCKLGSGCIECGGLGAIWDTTDYEELGAFMAKVGEEEDAQEREIADLRARAEKAEADTHGPYGYIIKPIGLAEDEWSLSFDPDPSPDVVCVPLFAREAQALGETLAPTTAQGDRA